MTRYARIASPLGALLVIAVGGSLTGVHFVGGKYVPDLEGEALEDLQFAPIKACAPGTMIKAPSPRPANATDIAVESRSRNQRAINVDDGTMPSAATAMPVPAPTVT